MQNPIPDSLPLLVATAEDYGTFDYLGIVKDGSGYKWALVGNSE